MVVDKKQSKRTKLEEKNKDKDTGIQDTVIQTGIQETVQRSEI